MKKQLTEKVKGMWANDFQSFLEEYWMDNFMEGQSKDQAIEAMERWIEQLDVEELISLADIFGDLREMKALKTAGTFNV